MRFWYLNMKKNNYHLCVVFTNKNLISLLEFLPGPASLQSSVQHYEEKNTKIKQLLVKTKKELADAKQVVCPSLRPS